LVVPVKEGVTVAVNATGWLMVEALGVDVRLVVVLAEFTTSEKVPGVPEVKLESPL
jgi:hypothetical protein